MASFESGMPTLPSTHSGSELFNASYRDNAEADGVSSALTCEVNSSSERGAWREIWEWERLVNPHWLEQKPLPYGMHVCIGVLVLFVAVFAVIGNGLVLWSVVRFRSLRTSSNLFIVSLAVADLLMSLIDFPLFAVSSFLGHWPFGYNVCQLYAITTGTAGLVNINTLAAISYDRYTVVVRRVRPVHHVPRHMTCLAIAVVWLASVLWLSTPLLGWGRFTLEGTGTSCTFDYLTRSARNRSYVAALTLANFLLPLLVIVFSYVCILVSVSAVRRRLMDSWPEFSLETQGQGRQLHTELRTALTVLVIVVVFIFSWTPYVIVALIGLFGGVSLVTPMTSAVPCLLAKVATVSNPLLYSLGHPKFRKKIRLLVMSVLRKTAFGGAHSPIMSRDNPPILL